MTQLQRPRRVRLIDLCAWSAQAALLLKRLLLPCALSSTPAEQTRTTVPLRRFSVFLSRRLVVCVESLGLRLESEHRCRLQRLLSNLPALLRWFGAGSADAHRAARSSLLRLPQCLRS